MDLKKLFRENQILIIWITAFILLIILIVLTAVLGVGKQKEITNKVTNPLISAESTATTSRFSISDALISGLNQNISQLPVYETINIVDEAKIIDLIQKNSLQLTKGTCTKTFCMWSGNNGSIQLDSAQASLFINLYPGKKIRLAGFENVNSDNASQFLQKFFSDVLGVNVEFANVKFAPYQNIYQITANRKLGDYLLYRSGVNDYTDSIEVSSTGDIYVISVLSVKAFDAQPNQYDIIKPSQVATLINTQGFSKVVNKGAFKVTSTNTNDSEIDFIKYGPNGEPTYDLTSMPSPDICTADSVQLAYYFNDTRSTNFIPTYKVHCVGQVTYKSTNFEVPLTVYLNAVDPKYLK